MAISWKWSQIAQKWPTRQIWGCFQHLENFLSPGCFAVCSIGFGNSISFNPGRSGLCSSWQSCRSHLALQVCQLHHLLIRSGLGDNHRPSRSVSRPMLCLNRFGPRRRGRPAAAQRRQLAPVRRSWPRLSALVTCMTSTASPAQSGRVHFAPPRLHSPEKLRSELSAASSLRRARVRSSLRLRPPNSTQSSAVSRSPSSTL